MKKYKILEECEEMCKKADTLDEEQGQILRDEVYALGEAVRAIRGLASKQIRDELIAFMSDTEGRTLSMKIGHKSEMINSFDADYWVRVMSHRFFRGDCCEQPSLRGRSWAKV